VLEISTVCLCLYHRNFDFTSISYFGIIFSKLFIYLFSRLRWFVSMPTFSWSHCYPQKNNFQLPNVNKFDKNPIRVIKLDGWKKNHFLSFKTFPGGVVTVLDNSDWVINAMERLEMNIIFKFQIIYILII
jgi:hypothetical protein